MEMSTVLKPKRPEEHTIMHLPPIQEHLHVPQRDGRGGARHERCILSFDHFSELPGKS